MYQIDVPSVAAALPAPAAAGVPGFFTNGDPVGGLPATVLDADFVNMLMMELINVVKAAGAAPSKTIYTQVRDAIGMIGSIAPSGYLKLPLGLIIQWGTAAIPNNGTSTSGIAVTFPIAFTQAVYFAGGNADAPANPSWGWLGATMQSVTLTSMQVVGETANPNNPIASGKNVRWLVIGK